MKYNIGLVTDVSPGECRLVKVEGREIGIFNVKGKFHAVRNMCPHQGAPICQGPVSGTNLPSLPNHYIWGKEGEVLRCPWHGWEFDLKSGASLFKPSIRVKTYPVEVEGDQLVLHLTANKSLK